MNVSDQQGLSLDLPVLLECLTGHQEMSANAEVPVPGQSSLLAYVAVRCLLLEMETFKFLSLLETWTLK